MKKRLIAIMCCVALALSCAAIAGCGGSGGGSDVDLSDSAYVGTWKATKATFQGEEVAAEEVFTSGDLILLLNADGTAELSEGTDKSTGNWSEADGGVKVKGDDINMTFKDTDGVLEGEVIGMHIFFEKQA